MKNLSTKIADGLLPVVALAASIYHLAYTQYIIVSTLEHQNIHLFFALTLIFLAALRTTKKWRWMITSALILAAIVSTGYVGILFEELELRAGVPTPVDVVIGILLVLLVLEACRQSFGLILPSVVLIVILYAFLGQYLPPPFYHPPLTLEYLISMYSIGFQGIYGLSLGVSAKYVFLFVLYGGVLQHTAAMKFFFMFASHVGKKIPGGAGLTSVVSSALVGMVTGSPSANVTLTGSFTIPLMKQVGYKPEQAGAIEAAASTGGQIMPPIMGVAVFVMSSLIGVPYIVLCGMYLIPAILYFFAVGLYVVLQGTRFKISPLPTEVDVREMCLCAPVFVIPLSILIFLLVRGYSPQFAAFWLIISTVIVSLIRKKTRPSLRQFIQGFTDGAINGGRIAAAIAVVGPLITTLTITGLAVWFPSLVESWSGGNLVVALFLTMIISIILGTGVPTLIAYLLVAFVVAPSLTTMGVNLVTAHSFAFLGAVAANVTPPVALASVVAAGMAGAKYFRTALESVKASFVIFLLPFLVLWSPVLMLQPSDLISATLSLIAVVFALLAISIVFVNQYLTALNPIVRTLMALSAAGLLGYIFAKSHIMFAGGIVLFILISIWQLSEKKKLLRLTPKVPGEE